MAYYDASDYQLKYRWSGFDNRNRAITLDIYQKSEETFDLTYIGGLVSLDLNVQGSQGGVADPIIKTSLNITLLDAPDEVQEGYKYGDWCEFFTPDSTKYLVMLYRGGTLLWRGYITPDSWQESLEYRGSVTVTARDNLGHLQDFDFDAVGDTNGLISISDLLTAALTKISFPMDMAVNTSGDAQYLSDVSGSHLLNAMIYAPNFEDRTWYDVLETVLESVGYCLRFCDGATFVCQPVRNLPLCGGTSRATVHAAAREVEFYNGNRSNDPAYREIQEKVTFGSEDTVPIDIFKNLAYNDDESETTYVGVHYISEDDETGSDFLGRYWSNVATGGATDGGWLAGGGYLRVTTALVSSSLLAEDGAEALKTGVLMACDKEQNHGIVGANPTYRITNVLSTDITVCCAFARPVKIGTRNPDTIYPYNNYMARAYMYISYVSPSSSVRYYWNGQSWQAAAFLLEAPVANALAESYGFEIGLKDISNEVSLGGYLDIEFANIRNIGGGVDYGPFARLTELSIRLNAKSVLKSDTVTTINNSEYNVKVTRKPVVGAMSATMSYFAASNYPAALWKYSNGWVTPYGYANYWSDFSAGTAIPLPAQIHKQLLCFNHISLQSLEGTFGSVDKDELLGFNMEYLYKGQYYLLHSGNLDVLRNTMRSAMLHGYIWYDDLWDETNNPQYSGRPVYETHSAQGSINGMSPASGGTGSSVVNFFEEDGNGGVKLRDEYNGLWAAGFVSAGGLNPGSGGGGGVDMGRVWQDLANDPYFNYTSYTNDTKISIDHIPMLGIWRDLANDSSIQSYDADTQIALSHIPDITTAKINNLGTWPGSANITTLGTVTTGTWNADAIPVSKGGTGRTEFSEPYAVLVMSSGNSIGYVGNNDTSTRKFLSQVNGQVPQWVSISISTPAATDNTIGGFKTGYTSSNKKYAVQLDDNDKAFVSVPWSNTNTTYKLTVNGNTNGDSGGTNLGSIYAPVDAGTSGYVLASGGANTAPSWINNPTFAALRLKQPSSNYGSELYFGDGANAYIKEDTDDHLLFHAANGITIDSATVIGSTTTNKNLTVYGALYLGKGAAASAYWDYDGTYSRMHTNADVKVDGAMIVGGTASNKDLTIFGKLRLGKTVSPATSYIEYDTDNAALHTNVGLYSNSFITAGVVASSSDERLKANLKDIVLTVDQIADARAVEFDWLKPHRGRGCGSIAQYWEKVLPLGVSECGGFKTMQYGNIALISAIILARKVRELENELKKLRRAAA